MAENSLVKMNLNLLRMKNGFNCLDYFIKCINHDMYSRNKRETALSIFDQKRFFLIEFEITPWECIDIKKRSEKKKIILTKLEMRNTPININNLFHEEKES